MKGVLKDLKLSDGDNNIIKNLYKPLKEPYESRAHVSVPNPGQICQSDILYLPNDHGFKYLLVVVDLANHAMDCEPLKSKTSEAVYHAFTVIFSRKYIEKPNFLIETDPGTEFIGKMNKYYKENNIYHRIGKAGRHRQQGVVENYNKIIGKLLFQKMAIDEIETGEVSKDWVNEIPDVVKALNKHLKHVAKPPNSTVLESSHEKLLPIGTKVRIPLEEPRSTADNSKLHGKFRAHDIRWQVKPEVVEDYYFRADEPPQYIISNNDRNVFTRPQLQEVKANESKPKPRKYVIEKILKKVKKGKNIYYVVKWKGYEETTEEPRAQLLEDVPELLAEFEKR
jgi:Chromo (CHRromatin Organisation MOdifier) domain